MTNYLLLLIVFAALFLPSVSLAQGLVPCGPGAVDTDGKIINCQLCHIFVLFNNVVEFLLITIVPVIAVLMIAIGGFIYVFAYFGAIGGEGGPALILKARKLFFYTIVGLIIIYAAWLIVSLFFQIIGVMEWTGLANNGWSVIDCPIR